MDVHDSDHRLLDQEGSMTAEERLVIFASSLGTVFEWYDFYIYGTLAPIPRRAVLCRRQSVGGLHLYAARLRRRIAVRPFGALFFGRSAILIGRKYTFLITTDADGAGHILPSACCPIMPRGESLRRSR
jgi:hypothetical protein